VVAFALRAAANSVVESDVLNGPEIDDEIPMGNHDIAE